MLPPQARYLPDGAAGGRRLHLQHGPIDLVIGVDADDGLCRTVFEAAIVRFETVLQELVDELPLLRSEAAPAMPRASGSTARRMVAAVRPHAVDRFITPMAAVAGAVADEMLATMMAAATGQVLRRVYVNNGGDIALHLAEDTAFHIRVAREDGTALGVFRLDAGSPSRGVATSGRGGRSLSFGIADSVTVVARDAAAADAAATLIANAVDLQGHPAIVRVPASARVDDSDLGDRLVVLSCGRLNPGDVERALENGLAEAERLIGLDLMEKAALFLQGEGRVAGGNRASSVSTNTPVAFMEHAPHA
ncbi:UPF0280 family protein [Rhizobium sp. TRM95111]|uniref:UPF0280 family protein n=1 Tax=Rhizobium alarense TaxID=2846851 RepID=UPI001F2EC32E|nr:UPF0280 family protein [Rhizobium alarense]MCF3642673.1 UPF0280 family protein [Rhizobium alarense]